MPLASLGAPYNVPLGRLCLQVSVIKGMSKNKRECKHMENCKFKLFWYDLVGSRNHADPHNF